MHHYTAYGLNFASDIELVECVRTDAAQTDFVIRSGTFPIPELTPVNIRRRGGQAACAIGPDGACYIHWEGVATFRAVEGRLLEVQAYTNHGDVLSLFTVCEALGLILFQRQYFLLHASAVQVGHEAWVFIANPGTGKSTTSAAFVKAGCPLLSDDLTAIVFDDTQSAYVQPGYPQLKIWESAVSGLGYDPDRLPLVTEGVRKYALYPSENFPSSPVRLTKIFFLEPTGGPTVPEEMSPGIFPVECLKHFSLSNFFIKAEHQVRFFKQSVMCARSSTIFRLSRPDGFAALEQWVERCIEEAYSSEKTDK